MSKKSKEEEYIPYTAKRWTDIPKPRVVGHFEITEEEKKEYEKNMERLLKKYGVIKQDESLEELKKSGEIIDCK